MTPSEFWQEFLSAHPEVPADARFTASRAGDERNCDALLQLYLDGRKTAGSGLVRDYEVAGDPLPEVGAYWIILDSRGEPRCIVRCWRVDVRAFDEVNEDIARAEGEGDLSLDYWRNAHREFFAPYLGQLGIKDLNTAEVVTEFYTVVFPR